MTQKYRTTCFADVVIQYEHSLEDTPKWREEVVGFRLARQSPSVLVPRHGSMYYDLPEDASSTYSRQTRSAARVPSIGFRLVLEGEKP